MSASRESKEASAKIEAAPTIASIRDQITQLCEDNGSERFHRGMMVDDVYRNFSIDLGELKQLLLEIDSEDKDKKVAALTHLYKKLMEWNTIEKAYFSGMYDVDDVELGELFKNTDLLFQIEVARSVPEYITKKYAPIDEYITQEYAPRASTATIFWGLGANPLWDMGAGVDRGISRVEVSEYKTTTSDILPAVKDTIDNLHLFWIRKNLKEAEIPDDYIESLIAAHPKHYEQINFAIQRLAIEKMLTKDNLASVMAKPEQAVSLANALCKAAKHEQATTPTPR